MAKNDNDKFWKWGTAIYMVIIFGIVIVCVGVLLYGLLTQGLSKVN